MINRSVCALLLISSLDASQVPSRPSLSAGTGLVVGQVVDAASGRPVAGAIVGISGGSNAPSRVLTGSDGRFVFRDLGRAAYNITATKPGYADGAHA